ncbi:hypothetical protein PanWU01x14_333200 [Parasponia andersonii]|uniref:Uncharacterized protein n=1 Tax=Parasponia andersonii TaxID=3476 RepID=A0A2P5AGZ7_PARAD|nr:hypothetical protein PanWU01x14_333200 [Parasponia andersonii]
MTAPATVVNPISGHLRLAFPQILRSISPRSNAHEILPVEWPKYEVIVAHVAHDTSSQGDKTTCQSDSEDVSEW